MSRAARVALGALAAAACGAGSSDKEASPSSGGFPFDAGVSAPGTGNPAGPIGTGTGGTGGGGGVVAPPPEVEERLQVEAPRAGARFVYVANPRRDSVAVIDATSLQIRSVPTGDAPSVLATAAGRDLAVTINVGSRDATILRSSPAGTTTSTVPVVPGANALAIAPDGAHAVAWYDAAAPGAASRPPRTFQDLSLITLAAEGDSSTPLTVGFRPTAVTFASDGSGAFVVTEDGVSVIRFAEVGGRQIVPLFPAGPAGSAAAPRDVTVTPDGQHALARLEGASTARLVDLRSGATATLELGAPITDLDLAPDGKTAYAVLRETRELVIVPVPGGFADSTLLQRRSFPDEAIGSITLSPDGAAALLFTTVGDLERVLLVALPSGAARPVRLRKTVRAVAFSPSGATAIIVHGRRAGDPEQPGLDVEERIDRSFGHTVIDVASAFPKLTLTPAEVGPLLVTPDSARAFVLLRDDARGLRLVQRIDLGSLFVEELPLGSPPISVGAVPASQRVFISQLHAEGRITFVDWQSGASASVTGFELNGRIVE